MLNDNLKLTLTTIIYLCCSGKSTFKSAIHYYLLNFRPLAKITTLASDRYRKPPPQLGDISRLNLLVFGFFCTSYLRILFLGVAEWKKGEESGDQLLSLVRTWDPLLWTARETVGLLESPYFCLALSLFPLYAAFFQYMFEFRVREIAASQLMVDLYILNAESFLQLNLGFLFPCGVWATFKSKKLLKRFFKDVLWKVCLGRREEDLVGIRLEGSRLPQYPGITRMIRIQAALLATAIELLVSLLVIPVLGGGTICTKLFAFLI